MKWKYSLNEDKVDAPQPQQIFINQAAPQSSAGTLRVVENTIFFYNAITDSTVLELNQVLLDIDSKLKSYAGCLGPEFTPHINLRLLSDGGSVLAAISVVDIIRNLRSKIHTYVDGYAASAATLISIAGHKRYIGKNAMMLIHQLSSMNYGKFSELEDDMENNRRVMKLIKDIYKQYAKIPMKQLDDILKHDLLFDAPKCLELGLVDHII